MLFSSRKAPGFHLRIGEIYHWVMLGVCLSAAALALLPSSSGSGRGRFCRSPQAPMRSRWWVT
jgi:hypothetical protein